MIPECCRQYKKYVFVFGSNEAGRHGAGAAAHAYRCHGAVVGTGYGRQGEAFAVPTKDRDVRTLPLWKVQDYVNGFLAHASLCMRTEPETRFYVTRVGCGLASFTDAQIAPLFRDAPENCLLPEGWRV